MTDISERERALYGKIAHARKWQRRSRYLILCGLALLMAVQIAHGLGLFGQAP